MDLKKISLQHKDSVEPPAVDINQISFEELSSVQDASLKEIILNDFLCFVEQENFAGVVDLIVQKMRYGATLTLCGKDIIQIARLMMKRELPLPMAKHFLYSKKKSSYSCLELISEMEARGLRVLRKNLDDITYTIIMERPNARNGQ